MIKRGQAGIEYLILVGFVTVAVISSFSLAIIYSHSVQDSIVLNQVESFAGELISTSETVFFSGEPSKTTVNLYLPKGVFEVTFDDKEVIIKTSLSSGENVRVFESAVPIQGTISPAEGRKVLVIAARDNYVEISN